MSSGDIATPISLRLVERLRAASVSRATLRAFGVVSAEPAAWRHKMPEESHDAGPDIRADCL